MKTGQKDVMIQEFRVAFNDLEVAKEHADLKNRLGYKNVSVSLVDKFYCVNWDRK